jgi:hypothetical protein
MQPAAVSSPESWRTGTRSGSQLKPAPSLKPILARKTIDIVENKRANIAFTREQELMIALR